MFVYLNNILVLSCSSQENVVDVRQVLQHSLENQLFVKAEKCEFHRSTTSFLGYIIAAGNVQMDPGKVRAVVDWPQPMSSVQLQHFLGFTHFYHRFIQGYSTLAFPFQPSSLPKSRSRGPQLLTGCSWTLSTASPQLPY